MAQEIRKFSEAGAALLQALEERHRDAMSAALNTIARDMGVRPADGWQADARRGVFVRNIPDAPPQERKIPVPPPVPPTNTGETADADA